jgi:hypothetical protein
VDRPRRRLRLTVGLAVAVVAATLAVAEWPRIRVWYRPPRADLPPAGEIVELRASVWASGSRGQYETDVPEFTVPPDQIARIWRRLEPSRYDPSPPTDRNRPFGELVATMTDGSVTQVRFYETGGDELLFTADGEHFFRSEPRTDQGEPLGGAMLLAGTLRRLAIPVAEQPQ